MIFAEYLIRLWCVYFKVKSKRKYLLINFIQLYLVEILMDKSTSASALIDHNIFVSLNCLTPGKGLPISLFIGFLHANSLRSRPRHSSVLAIYSDILYLHLTSKYADACRRLGSKRSRHFLSVNITTAHKMVNKNRRKVTNMPRTKFRRFLTSSNPVSYSWGSLWLILLTERGHILESHLVGW